MACFFFGVWTFSDEYLQKINHSLIKYLRSNTGYSEGLTSTEKIRILNLQNPQTKCSSEHTGRRMNITSQFTSRVEFLMTRLLNGKRTPENSLIHRLIEQYEENIC